MLKCGKQVGFPQKKIKNQIQQEIQMECIRVFFSTKKKKKIFQKSTTTEKAEILAVET